MNERQKQNSENFNDDIKIQCKYTHEQRMPWNSTAYEVVMGWSGEMKKYAFIDLKIELNCLNCVCAHTNCIAMAYARLSFCAIRINGWTHICKRIKYSEVEK